MTKCEKFLDTALLWFVLAVNFAMIIGFCVLMVVVCKDIKECNEEIAAIETLKLEIEIEEWNRTHTNGWNSWKTNK